MGAGVAVFLSIMLANGTIELEAPQAKAFATFTILLAEGAGDIPLLALGFALGCFVEWATGMGTSFGLGMYLPSYYTFPFLVGGYARDKWEEKKLDPMVEEIKEEEGAKNAEKARALALLGTFMIGCGMLTGEAFFGTESAVLAFLDTLVPDTAAWPLIRLGVFILVNVLLGGMIYAVFKKIGIIGATPSES